MSITFGGEQVSELPNPSPSATLDELRDYILRLHHVIRAREPVAAGDPLSKFVIRGELVELGLVGYEAGETGAGNSSISVSTTFTTGGTSSSVSTFLTVVDDAGTAVDLVVGQLRRCTNVAAVTATLPSTVGLGRGSICGVFCTNALTTNEVDRNGAKIAGATNNLVLNPRGFVVVFQFLGDDEGWAVALWYGSA